MRKRSEGKSGICPIGGRPASFPRGIRIRTRKEAMVKPMHATRHGWAAHRKGMAGRLLIPALVLTLGALVAAPAQAQEWRKIGGEPDPLGRIEPVRFVKDATVIEPAESDLSVRMIVFCNEESPKATVAVRLTGSLSEGALGALRIDGGELVDILWFASRVSTFMELENVDPFGDGWKERLKAGSEAIVSFEPAGRTSHYFRLNLAGLATRIEMCETAEIPGSLIH